LRHFRATVREGAEKGPFRRYRFAVANPSATAGSRVLHFDFFKSRARVRLKKTSSTPGHLHHRGAAPGQLGCRQLAMEEHAWRPFVFIEFDPRQPTFMAHRAARHRPKPRSGPRCHDTDHHLIAAPACRRTLLPPLHRCRLDASEGTCDAVDHAKIILSTAAATTNSRLGSSIRRHRLWPAYPLPKPPPRQIPIDRPSNPHRPPVKSP
jgi:hypothetical protein